MGKNRYPIDIELKKLEKIKLFPNIYVYPFVNLFMGLNTCRSDEKVAVRKCSVPGYKGQILSTLVIEPRNCLSKVPCIIFFHGGGLMLKAAKSHYQFAKWYAEKAKCKVVFPDYRLIPKYRFPYAVEDCYGVYDWVINSADELGVDKNKVILTGDSAGANLAAAVTLMARDRAVTSPLGVLMSYPVLDRRMNTESMRKFTDTPVFDANLARIFWGAYLADTQPEHIEYASPMEAETLEGFPETYIEVAEFDCLHDDGIAFAERLKTEGTKIELHELNNSCHGFEVALESNLVKESLLRRINWISKLIDDL